MLREVVELPGGHKDHFDYNIDENGHIIKQSDHDRTNNISLQRRIISKLSSMLLPIGYPSSVSSEYMQYQFYDTIQELCGYLKGIVMSQASLTGLGVGDSSVKISNVLLTWTIKDLITMLLGLWVSAMGAKIYGANMKIFWFLSALLNSICGLLTLFAAIYTKYYGILLILSSVLNTIGSVPGGIAKAGLAHHLAKNKNYSDVAAKEGNQSRCSKIFMIYAAYKYIEYMADNIMIAWLSYLILAITQLIMIYKSIQTLILRDLNHVRMELILKAWFVEKKTERMTPKYVSDKESMAVLDVLHFFINDSEWNIYFGQSIKDLDDCINIKRYMQIFEDFEFMVIANNKKQKNMMVILSENACAKDQILAYSIGYNIRRKIKAKIKKRQKIADDELFEIIKECVAYCKQNGDKLLRALDELNWDVNDVKFCDGGWKCVWQ